MDVCLVRMHPPIFHIYLSHYPPNAIHAYCMRFGSVGPSDISSTTWLARTASCASPPLPRPSVAPRSLKGLLEASLWQISLSLSIHILPPSIHLSTLSVRHTRTRARTRTHARTHTHTHTHARAYTHTHTRCATRLLTWPRRPGSRRRWESYRAPVCVQRQPKDLCDSAT